MGLFLRLAPIIFVCLWATGFVGARLGMPHAEPGTFLSLRFAVAFAILSAFALLMRAPWPKGIDVGHTLMVGALVHGIYLGGVFWAVRQGMPGGVSAILVGLQPLVSAVLAGVWLDESITRRHWAGLAIGLAGVVMVLAPKVDVADSGINGPTIVACLIAVSAISIGTIYQKRFLTLTDLRTGTALQYAGAIVPTAVLAVTAESFEIAWTGELIFAFVWLVAVLSIAAVFLLMWLIRQGSVAQVSSLFFLVPAVAAAMTYVLFGETLLPIQIFGMVLCALAVAIGARGLGRSAGKPSGVSAR